MQLLRRKGKAFPANGQQAARSTPPASAEQEGATLALLQVEGYHGAGTNGRAAADSTGGLACAGRHLHHKRARHERHHFRLHGTPAFPLQADSRPTPDTQVPERTFRPRGRQGRQQMDKALMALQQHFADACHPAEVAVYLERRVRTEQVGEGAAAMMPVHRVDSRLPKAAQQLPGAVAVAQACPEVHFPGAAPAGAFIAAAVQRHPAGFCQLRRAGGRNLVTGMQTVKVGHVAVVHIHLAVVFQPLLQVSFLADLHRREVFHVALQGPGKCLVAIQ